MEEMLPPEIAPVDTSNRKKVIEDAFNSQDGLSKEDIIANHIQNLGLNVTVEQFMQSLAQAIKSGFKVIRIHNVLIAYQLQKEDQSALMYIINGDSPKNYLRAVTKFIDSMRKAQVKLLKMYVEDQESATKIANATGVQDVSFEEDLNRDQDPYLMTMVL